MHRPNSATAHNRCPRAASQCFRVPHVGDAQLPGMEQALHSEIQQPVTEVHKDPWLHGRESPRTPLLGGCSSSLQPRSLILETPARTTGRWPGPPAKQCPELCSVAGGQNCSWDAYVCSPWTGTQAWNHPVTNPSHPRQEPPQSLSGSLLQQKHSRRTVTNCSWLQLCHVVAGLRLSPCNLDMRQMPSHRSPSCHHLTSLGT